MKGFHPIYETIEERDFFCLYFKTKNNKRKRQKDLKINEGGKTVNKIQYLLYKFSIRTTYKNNYKWEKSALN